MLDAYEARLRPNQTQEERYRAYPDPKIETKHLEFFQRMIEGPQALLDKQRNKQRSFDDQVKSQVEGGQVPSGLGNLVSSDGAITEGPQKTNKRRRHRANARRKVESPPPQETMEPKVEPKMVVPNSVSEEKQEEWMKSLWDDI